MVPRRGSADSALGQEWLMGLMLNIGSGPDPFPPPWINVDLKLYPQIAERGCEFMQKDIRSGLGFYSPGEASHIYANQFIEHLTETEWPAFVAECARLLQPGGTIYLCVPDVRGHAARCGRGEETLIQLQAIVASTDWGHVSCWDGPKLYEAFHSENGPFRVVACGSDGWNIQLYAIRRPDKQV
jgi:hypothetical protein